MEVLRLSEMAGQRFEDRDGGVDTDEDEDQNESDSKDKENNKEIKENGV